MAVTGIGGIFFRAKDPAKLNEWYTKYFGVNNMNVSYEPWLQREGPTVFALFPTETDYFGSQTQQFMLNFRTDDLDTLISWLRTDGVKIVKDIEAQGEVGRFASIEDPEGNLVELWEPQQ